MIFCSFLQICLDWHHNGVVMLKQTVGWNNLPILSDAQQVIPMRHYINAFKIHAYYSLDFQAETLDLTV